MDSEDNKSKREHLWRPKKKSFSPTRKEIPNLKESNSTVQISIQERIRHYN